MRHKIHKIHYRRVFTAAVYQVGGATAGSASNDASGRRTSTSTLLLQATLDKCVGFGSTPLHSDAKRCESKR
jgi:hypothetical protein